MGPWDEYRFIIETLRAKTVGCIQHRGPAQNGDDSRSGEVPIRELNINIRS